MPVLVYQYGPKEAVPIMAVAAVMANLSGFSRGGARSTGAPVLPIRFRASRRRRLAPALFWRCPRMPSIFRSGCF